MYRTSTGHTFIPFVANEVSNYVVTIPLYGETSCEIGEVLINHLIFAEDKAFLLSGMQYIYKRLIIKLRP